MRLAGICEVAWPSDAADIYAIALTPGRDRQTTIQAYTSNAIRLLCLFLVDFARQFGEINEMKKEQSSRGNMEIYMHISACQWLCFGFQGRYGVLHRLDDASELLSQ